MKVEDDSILPYQQIRLLGRGGQAVVEEVKNTKTGKLYARKAYLLCGSPAAQRRFENEVATLKRLSQHPHIVSYVSSYTYQHRAVIILQPVASEGSLANFLNAMHKLPLSDRWGTVDGLWPEILSPAVRCLIRGLATIHNNTTRYKDIKPANILVHNGHVPYSDFGIAFDASDLDSTTTTEITLDFDRKYCPPEVVHKTRGKRNRKSDIFALGCVFAEIFSALNPDTLPREMLTTCFAENYETVVGQLYEQIEQATKTDNEKNRFLH